MELYPSNDAAFSKTNAPADRPVLHRRQAGTLPEFSLRRPRLRHPIQENPQNIVVGEAFLAKVVNALGASPLWRKTLLIITYDEHGGYYDHVPPPVALAPDSIPPTVQPGRVDATTVSPATASACRPCWSARTPSRATYHVVYDHTSILAFVERKWNLQAMTYRDANANDLLDFLDLGAMKSGRPIFSPAAIAGLPASGKNRGSLACSSQPPARMPPAGSVRPR